MSDRRIGGSGRSTTAAYLPDRKMMEKLQKRAADDVFYRAGYCHSKEPDHVMNFKTRFLFNN